MYYSKIIPDPENTKCQTSEHAFRAYFQDNDEALGHAAVLLGGRRGARLINAAREALDRESGEELRKRLAEGYARVSAEDKTIADDWNATSADGL